MIVKFYNSYTSHEEYFEITNKWIPKIKRNGLRLTWIAKDLGAPKNWREDEDWKSEVLEAYESSEETIIKPKAVKL